MAGSVPSAWSGQPSPGPTPPRRWRTTTRSWSSGGVNKSSADVSFEGPPYVSFHRLRLFGKPPVGNPQHDEPGKLQLRVPDAVTLEGGCRAVPCAAVQLHDQPLLTPQHVDLHIQHPNVHGRLRKSGIAAQIQELPFE